MHGIQLMTLIIIISAQVVKMSVTAPGNNLCWDLSHLSTITLRTSYHSIEIQFINSLFLIAVQM